MTSGPLGYSPSSQWTAEVDVTPDLAAELIRQQFPSVAAPEQAGPLPAEAQAPGICHGDLHLRHLLVTESGSVTGVIDWGDLCLGDPAIDLSIAYLAFADPARDELLAAYRRPVGAARELAARTCALPLAAGLAEYAADDGRPALLRESVAGIRRSAT